MTQSAFAALGVAPAIVSMLESQQITEPTPIQAAAIPELLAGHDLMASAQTGTGKTAAFLLPSLTKLLKEPKHHGRGPRILVLTPTRELADQVAKVATDFARRIPRCKVACFVGGTPYPVQNRILSQPLEVLVATPGRLGDLMRGGRIDFRRLEMLVIDEADRMLDMGFIDEVEAIVAALPKDRQTALFSATLSESVQEFAAPLLRAPKLIELAPATTPQPQIDQAVHYADGYEHKLKLTAALLKENEGNQSIVFTATKADADGVAEWLKLEGFRAAAMHGDMAQRDRRRTLERLRKGEVDMLIATDVAARGIDVAGISLVLNFDLPKFAEDYIHRIGRTGRAGRSGRAVSLVGKNDFQPLSRIRRLYKINFDTLGLPGLEANFRPERKERDGRRGNGRSFGGNKSFGGQKRHDGRNTENRHDQRSFEHRGGETRTYDRNTDNRGNTRQFDNRGESRSHDHSGSPYSQNKRSAGQGYGARGGNDNRRPQSRDQSGSRSGWGNY